MQHGDIIFDNFMQNDAKKSSNPGFVNFFGPAHNFLGRRDREKFFLQKLEIFYRRSRKYGLPEISPPQIVDGELFLTENPTKTSFFLSLRLLWCYEGAPASCQKLLILLKPEKNRHHK